MVRIALRGSERAEIQARRHEDRVDDVDHAVGREHVDRDDVRSIDRDATLGHDGDVVALDGRDVTGGDVLSEDGAGHDVVGQDADERVAVLREEQLLEQAFLQRSERCVGRCEDRERTLACEDVHEIGCLECGDEGPEAVGGYGDVDDGAELGLGRLVLVDHGAARRGLRAATRPFLLDLASVGLLVAIAPAVWGFRQLFTGALSDRIGRKSLIAGGQMTEAVGLIVIALGDGAVPWASGSVLFGAGTAMAYPTLIAAVGDVAHPSWRGAAVGVYRLWRDLGFAVGALLAGVLADTYSLSAAIVVVAVITAASGLDVAVRMRETLPGRVR